MPERPLVSIVTPTLNQGGFIEATIRSIKGQTYDHYEHIVVDGGSTDGTLDILRAHEGTYPMRWTSEPDRGMYDAVNKGMRQASGDILCYLNSDDLYFPWTLETVVAAFNRWPETGLVHGDVMNVLDEDGRQILYLEPPYDLRSLRAVGSMSQPGVFWRRSAFDRLRGFDSGLRYVADLDFFIRAGAVCKVRKVNEVVAIERDHAGTLRSSFDAAMSAEIVAVRERHAAASDPGRRVDRVRGGVWRRTWFRAYWLALLAQASLPSGLRVRWWRRWLAEGHGVIEKKRAVKMLLVPVAGRGLRRELIQPSRYWLEAPGP